MTDAVSTPRPHRSAADSQQRLAASIARQVQSDLPAPDSSQEVAGLVETALLNESRVNELTLAYFRVAGAAALTALGVAGYVQPSLFGAAAFPLAAPVGALVATLLSLGLVLALRRGWYRVWLRRWIPVADALIVFLAVVMTYMEPGLRVSAARPGLAAIGAGACLFLTFSGLMRLSGTAQRSATLLAVIDWALLALVLDIRPLAATTVAVLLVVLGIYGTRLTLMMRRVIAYQVERERLDHMYRAARSAVETREEVLRMVAHDLRNPLSTIGMTAELIETMPLEEEQRRKHAQTIARCGRAMNGLIQDLLDFARMEAGRMVIDPQPTEVDALLEHVAEVMTPIASAVDVTLEVAARTGIPPVAVDSERIGRVFSNLVGNAVKFTPSGGRVLVRAQRVGDKVRFAIVDTGPGIPPERVSSIFQGFWQAQSGDRRGIGLGLAIARHIIDAHGERIGVESQLGGGSEFWFTVPLARGRTGA